MNSTILQALLKLFAIVSNQSENKGRQVISVFLGNRLSQSQLDLFIQDYESYVLLYHKPRANAEKHASMTSVKVLRLCDEIQSSLNQEERITVFVRLVEFVSLNDSRTEQVTEFLDTVASSFNIQENLKQAVYAFTSSSSLNASEFFLIFDSNSAEPHSHLPSGQLNFFRVPELNLFFVRYFGSDELFLNGAIMQPNALYSFPTGSSIRGLRSRTIFYSDTLHAFQDSDQISHFSFEVRSVYHEFAKKKTAVDTLSFQTESGNLIGIMGGSGSGKSTLLNILNGNTKPKRGDVCINGNSIFEKGNKSRQFMGYISQDDILIEELTVFQNLFFNAELLFRDKTKTQIQRMVLETLQSVGLSEVKDLRVGSVLDKTISGGQRKRLNIALELIREPAILFVDEPTSGLSSRDSENIMDLLKELSLRGKLIFVVIHQPSSDIFNLFDQLLLLDQGGMPIYFGNPIDSILYFKKLVNQVNIEETKCARCGNVNPEQLFSIIEAKVIDEYGRETTQRKVSSKEWNSLFHLYQQQNETESRFSKVNAAIEKNEQLPRIYKQFFVFLKRDVLGKITNKQYLLINLLEAPLLAFLLSWFVKYEGPDGYSLFKNQNFPQFLFIAVVVSLFMGLTVSAEEIIKDQKILKREQYLGLNRRGYLWSKIILMFIISAIQTALFVAIGNAILEVHGMFWPFFLILFSTACFANVLGLNISATFNSAKVIYIVIPILIIPQLLFSGVIVRFDRLNRSIMEEGKVSWIGDLMASRWAYEALAVYHFTENEFIQPTFDLESRLRTISFEKDFWSVEMKNEIQKGLEGRIDEQGGKRIENEISKRKEEPEFQSIATENILSNLNEVQLALEAYTNRKTMEYLEVNDAIQNWVVEQTNTPEKKKEYLSRQNTSHNESLEEFVTSKNDLKKIVQTNSEYIRKSNPVYQIPSESTPFLSSHFYAPRKNFFGKQVATPWANVFVLWVMSAGMILMLLFDVLPRVITPLSSRMGRSK